MAAGFQLNNGAPNSIEQIEGLKARDDEWNGILIGQRRILPIAHHSAYVTPAEMLHLVSGRLKNGSMAGGTSTWETRAKSS